MHRKQGLSLSVHVDDITMAGRKQNFNPMWKKLMKLHHFLTTVYLGCTQRERKSNECIVEEYKKMFESLIFAGATQKLLGWEKSHAETVAWSCDTWRAGLRRW